MMRAVLGASALTLASVSLHGCLTGQPPPAPPPQLLRTSEFIKAVTPEEKRRCRAYLQDAAPGGISAYGTSSLSRADGELLDNLTLTPEWRKLNKRFMCGFAQGFETVLEIYEPLVAVHHGKTYEETLAELTRDSRLLEESWHFTPFFDGTTVGCHRFMHDGTFCRGAPNVTALAAFLHEFHNIFNHTFMDAVENRCGRALMSRCAQTWYSFGVYIDPSRYGGPRRPRWKPNRQHRLMYSQIQPTAFDDEDMRAPGALNEVSGRACGSDVSAFPSLEDTLANLSRELLPTHTAHMVGDLQQAAAGLAIVNQGQEQKNAKEAFASKITFMIFVTQVAKEAGPLVLETVGQAFVPGFGILTLLLQGLQATTGDAVLERPQQSQDLANVVSHALKQVLAEEQRLDIKIHFRFLQDSFRISLETLAYTPTVARWKEVLEPNTDKFEQSMKYAKRLAKTINDQGRRLKQSDGDLLHEETYLLVFHVSEMLSVLLFQHVQITNVYFTCGMQILLAEGKTRCIDSLDPCDKHLLTLGGAHYHLCAQALKTCDLEFSAVAHDLHGAFKARAEQWRFLLAPNGLIDVIDLLQKIDLLREERDVIDQLVILQTLGLSNTESPRRSVLPASKATPRPQRALLTQSCLGNSDNPDLYHQHLTVLSIGTRPRALSTSLKTQHGRIWRTAPDKHVDEWDSPLRTFLEVRRVPRSMEEAIHMDTDVKLVVIDNASSMRTVWSRAFRTIDANDFGWAPSVEGGFFVAYHRARGVTELKRFCRTLHPECASYAECASRTAHGVPSGSQPPSYAECATKEIEDTVRFFVPRKDGGLMAVTWNTLWVFTSRLVFVKSPFVHGDIHWAAPDATGGVWVSKRVHWKHTDGWTNLVRYDDDLNVKVELESWWGINMFVPSAGGGLLVWVHKMLNHYQFYKVNVDGHVTAHTDWWECCLEYMTPLPDGGFLTAWSSGAVWHLDSNLALPRQLLSGDFRNKNKILEECGGNGIDHFLSPVDWNDADPDAAGPANLRPWTSYSVKHRS